MVLMCILLLGHAKGIKLKNEVFYLDCIVLLVNSTIGGSQQVLKAIYVVVDDYNHIWTLWVGTMTYGSEVTDFDSQNEVTILLNETNKFDKTEIKA